MSLLVNGQSPLLLLHFVSEWLMSINATVVNHNDISDTRCRTISDKRRSEFTGTTTVYKRSHIVGWTTATLYIGI